MKSLALIAVLFGYVRSQTDSQYLPTVPEYISEIFNVIGTSCTSDSDCESAYNGPMDFDNVNNSMWICQNDTVVNGDELVEDIQVCVFDGCTQISDCEAGNICYSFQQCNPYDNKQYVDMEELESSICVEQLICNKNAGPLQKQGDWMNDTMCYVGQDGETYVSEEFAVMCGGDNNVGTCIIDDYVCLDPFMDTTNAAISCVDDETCCTKEGWDEEGCLELLITTYLIYTIIAGVVICLCCLGCCCCIWKKKKNQNAHFEDDMDNQTNHYNVYI